MKGASTVLLQNVCFAGVGEEQGHTYFSEKSLASWPGESTSMRDLDLALREEQEEYTEPEVEQMDSFFCLARPGSFTTSSSTKEIDFLMGGLLAFLGSAIALVLLVEFG